MASRGLRAARRSSASCATFALGRGMRAAAPQQSISWRLSLQRNLETLAVRVSTTNSKDAGNRAGPSWTPFQRRSGAGRPGDVGSAQGVRASGEGYTTRLAVGKFARAFTRLFQP